MLQYHWNADLFKVLERLAKDRALVAQLAEHLFRKQKVSGSKPLGGSN